MKNFEAYEDEIRNVGFYFGVTKNNEIADCGAIDCNECIFYLSCKPSTKIKWLYEEYQKPKVKIPFATKVILESLNEKYKWIAKDRDNYVWVYNVKPTKDSIIEKWFNGSEGVMRDFGDVFKDELFDFLSWEDEEPTNIKKLLENCEVIDDE